MMALSRIFCTLLVLWLGGLNLSVQAGTDVRVVGLFSERAVVVINGKRHLLKVGQSTPEGVRLLAADSESADLEIDGKVVKARLDGRITASKKIPGAKEFHISRNNRGMYTTVGSINGLTVSFLVDTGATLLSLNAAEARRLGIDFRVVGRPTTVTTASGIERAWGVVLDSVKLGDLEVQNVGAVVLEGAQPEQALLGMSYLGRLEMSNAGRLMTLRQKY
ncbi:MAG: TIGR02281 family clan AA aspartic protease [Gammaproteobacteria bacterium]